MKGHALDIFARARRHGDRTAGGIRTSVVVGTAIMAIGLPLSTAAHASAVPSRLYPGQSLSNGGYLQNGPSGTYVLKMHNGNMELWAAGSQLLFESLTGGHSNGKLVFGSGGDLKVEDGSGNALWRSYTASANVYDLSLNYNGDVVLETLSGTAVWHTSTDSGTSRLTASHRYAWASSDQLLHPKCYLWGGGHGALPGPTGSAACDVASLTGASLDCSGFTRWAYAQAADGQYNTSYSGTKDPLTGDTGTQIAETQPRSGSPVLGDVAFWGTSLTSVSDQHTGLYVGNGQVIDNFATGTHTRIDSVSSISAKKHFLGYRHL